MSEYKGIQGFTVQSLSSDPSPSQIGQVWYNSTSKTLKVTILETITTNAWASGGNVNTGRYGLAGAGTQTAALIFGGVTFPGGVAQSATEKYDGTNWTSVNPLNTARGSSDGSIGGAGTQTSALIFTGQSPGGGAFTGTTEKYDGTNWTTVNSMNTARGRIGGCGTQTSALVFGGLPPPASSAATEKYDGTNWTSVNSMNTAKQRLAGCGTQTSALAFGGSPPPTGGTSTEKYDGTNWTTVNSMNTARYGLAGAGTQTAALAFGGSNTNPVYLGNTELYDGTNWTSNPTGLATGRRLMGSAGTQSLALAAAGLSGGFPITATEEWTGSTTQIATKTITSS